MRRMTTTISQCFLVFCFFLIASNGAMASEELLDELLSRTRKSYDGPLVLGEDLMSFIINDEVTRGVSND
jgi:hypothetical protein